MSLLRLIHQLDGREVKGKLSPTPDTYKRVLTIPPNKFPRMHDSPQPRRRVSLICT